MCMHVYSLITATYVLNFRGWSQPQNDFNNEIFLIYGIIFKLCGWMIDTTVQVQTLHTQSPTIVFSEALLCKEQSY